MIDCISIKDPISYAEARLIQLNYVEKRITNKIADTFFFLEHKPVITRGRGLQWTGEKKEKHMPMTQVPNGVEFSESERGGDLTYHGPGQIVIYPICKLDGSLFLKNDIHFFLRTLEIVTIKTLEKYGLNCITKENATGVWINHEGVDKKIASIGIAVRKWVTYHGIAINLTNDLKPFFSFSPCGFQPEVMTNLASLRKEQNDVRENFEKNWLNELKDYFNKKSRGPLLHCYKSDPRLDHLHTRGI